MTQVITHKRGDTFVLTCRRGRAPDYERVLGLTSIPSLADRDGKPIPRSWDARQHEAY